MQATKQHEQQHSSSPRKDSNSSSNQKANSSSGSSSSSSNNNKSDSVAKLVMNINSTTSLQQNFSNINNSSSANNTQSNQTNANSIEQSNKTINNNNNHNSANSVESDKDELEEITSRTSKVDLNGISSKANQQNNDQNNNSNNNSNSNNGGSNSTSNNGSRNLSESDLLQPTTQQQQQQQMQIGNAIHGSVALTMPGLISSEPVVSSARQQQQQQILTPSKLNLDKHRRQRHHSSSKESVAKSEAELVAPTTTTTTTTITLDTKIPHPSTSETTSSGSGSNGNGNGNKKDHHLSSQMQFPGGNSSRSNSIEEVSYYNDQSPHLDVKQLQSGPSAAASSSSQLASGSAATTNSGSCSASSSSSCHNNNNTININNHLATGQQAVGSCGPTKSSGAGAGGRINPMPAKEQKLSIIVPNSTLGPFQSMPASGNNNNNNNNGNGNLHTNTTPLDLCSREYCNDFDDYDTRYDTAAMEEDPMVANTNSNNSTSADFEGPSSPKAKSAPATPCNVTPTAFHQHNSNNKSNLPNPANTLPVDTRRNISATCRMLPSSISLAHAHQSHHHQHQQHHQQQQQHNFTTSTATTAGLSDNINGAGQTTAPASAVSDQYLDNLIEEGDSLFRHENFVAAIRKFSQCIELATQSGHFDYLKKNFRVYSQRAEGYFKLRKYNQAIEDSMAARELNPKWSQAHYILGKAQFHLEKHVDSLTAFSFGLAQVPTDKLLFEALVMAALSSAYPKLDEFEENYNKLRERDLDKDPFVVVATLGQELLSKHHHQHAAIVLESALKLGTDNRRFKSSVLSTTSHVFCAIGDFKKALAYMKRELEIETELNDVAGQCRVLSNIGYNYYKMGKFVKSLEAHREQLKLAIQNKLHQQAAQAFNATGHVHVARNDFANALTSHQWCLDMLRSLGENEFDQFKELLAIGHVNSLLADYKTSEERYKEAMQMLDSSTCLKKEERQVGSIMVHFNLAYLALKRQSLMEALQHYESVISIARDMDMGQKRLLYELRALNGLGHTCRVFQRFNEARNYFERQLELAKKVNDLSSQSQALCNLGMTYQHFKDYNTAWKLFDENMQLVESNHDPLLKAHAHSYRGSMHFLWGEYTKAHEEYEKSLNIFKELEQCSAEMKSIELNMDAVSERLGRSQISLASNTARVQRKVIMA